MFDSRPDTYRHIHHVQKLLGQVAAEFIERMGRHDQSKLESPEVEVFNEFTPKLEDTEYGSEEYKSHLVGMGVGLKHHYENNSHHPEYYDAGINGMSLIDLTEMLVDWKAAGMRHADGGDILRSIEMNQARFGYSNDLKQILFNTAHDLNLVAGAPPPRRRKSA